MSTNGQLPTLYTLVGQYRDLMALCADTGDAAYGTGVPEDAALADTLEGLKDTLEVKATNVAAVVRSLDALAQSIEEAERVMKHRRTVLERRAQWLRDYLKANLEAAAIDRIEHAHYVIAIKKNPPAVAIDAPQAVPARYMVVAPAPPPAPDKRAIKTALENGEDVPGARLTRSTRLDIR